MRYRQIRGLSSLWIWFKARTGSLKHKIVIQKNKLYGRAWRIPIINQMGFDLAVGNGTEMWLYKELLSIHQTNPVVAFIDIGVNTGHTLLKVKGIDPSIVYYGFEPNPVCVYYTEYLIDVNKIEQAQIICVGLGSEKSIDKLYYHGSEDTRATIQRSSNSPGDLIHQRLVPIWELDAVPLDFVEKSNLVIKIDVEGHELHVLRGARNFIQKYRPIILFECLPHLSNMEVKQSNQDLFGWFVENRYELQLLLHAGTKEGVNKDFDNPSDYTRTDFIALPV